MSTVRGAVKLLAFALWSICLVPPQMVLLLFHRGQAAYTIPYIWQKGVCRIFGIKVRVEGEPQINEQTLFISNHLSYLDIPAIASVLKASFVAKADVQNWPVFGFLSTLQQTAFISRSRGDAVKGKNALSNMLAEGKSLILFPEGTSSDGTNILPFKSSLFSLALGRTDELPLTIQPLTLKLLTVDRQDAASTEKRDLYAWYGDMTLPPHLWAFAKSRGAELLIEFHQPRQSKDFSCRKELANTCHTDVTQGLKVASG